MADTSTEKNKHTKSFLSRLADKAAGIAAYCWTGVWSDTRDTTGIRILKTANLSVRSFLDRGLQNRSMALTYSTVLAIVPCIALIFAIARGFGFQKLIEQELYSYFPGQHRALEVAYSFVDSYLREASSGIFVGIGIVFLLWTLISLLSNIEEAFNMIWDVKRNRSMYQKITDYIAICMMVPVLMICSAGVSIFMATTLQDNIRLAFLTPLVNIMLELTPVFLSFLAFSLSFFLIPNTKVQFRYAAVSGAICAVVFQILQMLFVNGQIYVSKYNAIYGSFSFLPLLLIWLQLSWLILLFGCVLTYSMQNVFAFNFIGDLQKISPSYSRKVAVIIMAVVARRFLDGKTPLTRTQISTRYDIPIRIVANLCHVMTKARLLSYVMLTRDRIGVAPAVEVGKLSVGEVLRRIGDVGQKNFIPRFAEIYKDVLEKLEGWFEDSLATLNTHMVTELNLPEDVYDDERPEESGLPFVADGDDDAVPQ